MDTLKRQLARILDCQPLWRAALLISVAAILYLATTSEPYLVPASSYDKVNHLIAFAELTVLSRLAWPGTHPIRLILLLIAFGLLIEIIQSQLPYRDFSLADVVADAVGVVIGLLPWPGLRGWTTTREATQNRMCDKR